MYDSYHWRPMGQAGNEANKSILIRMSGPHMI